MDPKEAARFCHDIVDDGETTFPEPGDRIDERLEVIIQQANDEAVAEAVKPLKTSLRNAEDANESLELELVTASEREDALRAALEPFAKLADTLDGLPENGLAIMWQGDQTGRRPLVVADFRRAAEALGEKNE